MHSLIDNVEHKKMLNRIEKLTPDTKPLWGKMRVEQMLAHVNVAMRVALGENKLKRSFMGLVFGGIAKKQLFGPKPFGKGLPTASEFVMKTEKDYNIEKNELMRLMNKIGTEREACLSKEAHPFFGKMTAEQWDHLQHKHLDHHLSQFGV